MCQRCYLSSAELHEGHQVNYENEFQSGFCNCGQMPRLRCRDHDLRVRLDKTACLDQVPGFVKERVQKAVYGLTR